MRSWKHAIASRLEGLRLSPERESEIVDELSQHLDDRCDELLASGMADTDARRLALEELADHELLRQGLRPLRQAALPTPIPLGRQPGHLLADLRDDVRYSSRALSRTPAFSAVAVGVLAVGIGLVTTLFSFVNATMFRPWQVPHPESMVKIHALPAPKQALASTTIAEYRYLKTHTTTMAHVIATILARGSVQFDGDDNIESVPAAFVSADYFEAFEDGMSAGRGFTAGDEDFGEPGAVAIISEQLWRMRFGSDPAVIGRTIRIQKRPFTIVGVAARGFADVQRGSGRMDLWMPLPAIAIIDAPVGTAPDVTRFTNDRESALYTLTGRLRPGVSMAAAQAELTVLSRQFFDDRHEPSGGMLVTDTRPAGASREFLPTVMLIFLALVLVQVLACANVGNLLLARALSRQRDIAIRLALGASRGRIVRQLLTDAAMLSLAAAALGMALTFALPTCMAVASSGSAADMRLEYFAPDASVFWFALAVAVLTTFLCGLAPALRATRMNLASVAAERHGQTAGGARLRSVLLATQVAMTTLLLVGAGLLTHAIGHALSMDAGFKIEGVQTVSIRLPNIADLPRRKAFFTGVRDALKDSDLPPVAFSLLKPLDSDRYVMMAHRPDADRNGFHPILRRPVSSNYFAVLGIPIVEGRLPSSDDRDREIVVNQSAARVLWPGKDPIGETVLDGFDPSHSQSYEVVGVAKDVPVRSLADIEPVIYDSTPWLNDTLIISSLAPGVVDQLRSIAQSLEPKAVVTSRPLTDYVLDSLKTAVIGGETAWAIGGLGLALAMVGAFGVFAYAVEERRREIGIRMALGARATQVVQLVLMTTQRSVVVGLGAGLLLSCMAAPLLRKFLYGLSPFDVASYVEIAAILMVASALASWIPARRATRMNPAITLRCE